MDPIAAQLIARLQSDPRDRDAYDALRAHYAHGGDLASLANLLEGWAETNAAGDWQSASEAYAEAADAVLHSSDDRARAKTLYNKALSLNALQPHAANSLRALLEAHSEYGELAEFLDAHARALEANGGAPAEIAAAYRRLGEIWQNTFELPDVARDYLARAAQLESGAGADATAAEPALSPEQAHELAAQYEAQAVAEHDLERRAALLSQVADLRAGLLGDLDGAISALRQALAAAPGDIAIMHQLATCLLSRAGNAEPQAARIDHRRAAELFYQIAQGVDDTQAVAYLESALLSMPDHDGALVLLERVAPEQNQSAVLPRYWVGYVAAAAKGPEVDKRRLLLGEAYFASGQLEDAIYCLQPAAEHGNERAHELLQRVYARQATEGGAAQADAPDAISVATGADQAEAHDGSVWPTARPPARQIDDERARAAARIAELRKQVHEALSSRRNDEAAELCRAILELDPNDTEAFNLLESHCRKRRDYAGLRDLLLASTRVPGVAVETRKLRLREVATLSENKLRDSDGAISAWRSVATLDPGDREATSSLKRLLKKAQHWDELAAVLEREALATTGVDDKAALIREIALLHRDKRRDPIETAEAFRQLYALKPDDVAVREELCDLLIQLEHWIDVVPLLRERIAATKDDIDKLKWNATLASILHEKLADLEGAYQACTQILALRPSDKAAFERMERVDEEGANYARLLSTLERRALLVPKSERPALFMRMGKIAEEQLRDLDKAADYFGDALDLAPENGEALQRLVEMFERAARYEQLVELLRERCLLEKEPSARARLHRRIAQTLATYLGDPAGAAEAYRKLLEIEEDEEALRFLRDAATRADDAGQLAEVLPRLAARVGDGVERRDLWFDLAVVLHERLSRPAEAAQALTRLLNEVDARFEPAIELLEKVSEASGNRAGVAVALERRIPLLADAGARLPLAKRLADLCELELQDSARAIAALQLWTRDDPQNTAPLRRLRPLLTQAEAWPALLATLDALSEWEDEFATRDEAVIAAARVAFQHLSDAQDAWRRLKPLVEERNEQAEALLREVARGASLVRELSALYIQLAQQSEDPAQQAVYWRSAAEVFEKDLEDPTQALEAALRMLATDLGNREFLAYTDRLALHTKSFKRMGQVYDRLLKQSQDDAEKVELLKRHADLLEQDQQDEALDRILRACALAPHDEALLERAEQLALRTRRSEELLIVYDRRRSRSDGDAEKLHLLLRAARLCDGALRDRERANQYLKGALAVAGASAALGAEVEAVARELDAARPELGADQARRALIGAHREVAENAETAAAVRLMQRAAELLHSELDDERGGFDMLRQGLALAPRSDEMYLALYTAAEKLKRLDAVDAQLSRLIDEAIDSGSAVALLRRRGALLEGALNRFQDAAAVYTKLLQLRPDDAEAASKLRASLREAGRYQDLLLALNKQLQRTRDGAQRVALLREIAQSWERDLKNRWEALDAWKAVLREAPDDAEAASTVRRLERGRGSSPDPISDAPPAAEQATETVAEVPATTAATATPVPEATPAVEGALEADAEAIEAKPKGKRQKKRKRGEVQEESPPAARPADDFANRPTEPAFDLVAQASTKASERPATASAAPAAATAAADDDAETREFHALRAAVPPEPGADSIAAAPEAAPLDGAAPPARTSLAALEAYASATEDSGGLDALDAVMGGARRVEEVDVFEHVDPLTVDVEIEPAPPPLPAPRPPIPVRSARPLPTPHDLRAESGRSSSAPPPPPRRSVPPPFPGRGSQPGAPAPMNAADSTPPAGAPGARASQPPPLPGQRKSTAPPPLPSQRKPE